MLFTLGKSMRRTSSCAVLFVCFSANLEAHVGLDSPNGGESFVAGSTVTIEWHAEVQHDTVDWDLWYSTDSSSGPWTEISLNLPLGDPAVGIPHFFDWLVPDDFDTSAWIQVSQDNDQDIDYFDESDSSFSILAPGDFSANGQVGSADLAIWEGGYGTNTSAAHSDGDANLDGVVDGIDFLLWQVQSSGTSLTATVHSVPEPSTSCLFVLGCVIAAYRGRR